MKRVRYVKMVPVMVTIPIIPFLSVLLGIAMLLWVVWPILSFQMAYANFSQTLITPLSDEIAPPVSAQETEDLTHASNWFPKETRKKTVTPVDTYLLSIPKLRINEALVKIGTDDLSKNIIHYGGSGLPGKFGNTVLFGHSVLPSFYDPKNYLTIFSLLPTLKTGDDIFIKFDGVDYRYQVESRRITDPEDVTGLEQRFDDSYITLVTCVPPGTYWKRLWLSARQVPFDQE